MNDRVLYQTAQFYRAYPDFKSLKALSWSHYRYLSTVPDEKERRRLETRALKEGLSMDALALLVKDQRLQIASPTDAAMLLPLERGLSLVEVGATSAIVNNPQHPYTQRLLSAVPVPDPAEQKKRRELRDAIIESQHIVS